MDAPAEMYAPAPVAAGQPLRQSSQSSRGGSLREFGDDFASTLTDTSGSDDPDARRRRNGYRLRLNGRALQAPKTLWGRIFSAIAFLIFAGVTVAGYLAIRSFFLRDPRFTIASSSFIQTTGNTHLSRAQLLSVFGEDVERNIFNIPLAVRRTELESLPWVQRATVMRLLPNHIRIAITERTPVAFVRQANQIGMVDASGVVLDMPLDAPGDPSYSFPVVTGINSSDPLSTRAARMRIYTAFISDLDSTGDRISQKFSEVDLSNPEDVKALIPEGKADILVHFGDTDFLARYQKFQDHLHEWLTDHPKLASVDMRYARQVVLEMQPGAPTMPATAAPPRAVAVPPAVKSPQKTAAKSSNSANSLAPKSPPAPPAKLSGKPAAPPASTAKAAPDGKPAASEAWHMVVVKPHTKEAAELAKARLTHPNSTSKQAAPQ